MARGKFITFEGGDGVGKSTQIARLAETLKQRGIDCTVTREPGGTPFAERVREFILDGDLPPHAAMAEALLFAAARQDHVANLIEPALAAGRWVLCDRFADSTRAYQGAAGGVAKRTLIQLESLSHPQTEPDLTVILDLDPVAGKLRIAARSEEDESTDPFEQRDLDFQQRLRAAFIEIARSAPQRCRLIDASQSLDLVAEHIWAAVVERFELGGS